MVISKRMHLRILFWCPVESLFALTEVKLHCVATMCVLKLHVHHLPDCFNKQAPRSKRKTFLLKTLCSSHVHISDLNNNNQNTPPVFANLPKTSLSDYLSVLIKIVALNVTEFK